MTPIQLRAMPAAHDVSPLLYGIFLEDINFACDGGLSSNKIANHSFDGQFLEASADQMVIIRTKETPRVESDPLRYWNVTGGTLESRTANPASRRNPYYASLTSEGEARLTNRGHDGRQGHLGQCAISLEKGRCYHFSCWLRGQDYTGSASVQICAGDGRALTPAVNLSIPDNWQQINLWLDAVETAYGELCLTFTGTGRVDLDCVIFEDCDVWGKDDPKWTGGHFRKDLVEALKALHPSFMRFPGGCIVEGLYPSNEYQWKHTIGPVLDRIPAVNLWGATFAEKGYCQSNQIGFYEYFLLCEDLGMEPLPIVWAGLNCQFRSNDTLDTDSPEFLDQVVRNALDLIEYANGDPAESPWAAMRARAGHPAPFNMKMIGIGNENFGADYHEKFRRVLNAIRAKYPDMTCILSSGAFPQGDDFEDSWRLARTEFTNVRVDEHFYSSNEWVLGQLHRYDEYPRGTAQVFLGEYAANDVMVPHKPNTFGSALAEAAFLTGVERNSDVVAMTSYAPLFSMIDGAHWNHNLIWFNQQTHMCTANYYVQELFGAHIGKRYLPLEGDTPEDVCFSLTADDDNFYLKAVNLSQQPCKLSVELPGAADGAVRGRQLHSDDPQAANELDFDGPARYAVAPAELDAAVSEQTLNVELAARSLQVWGIPMARA